MSILTIVLVVIAIDVVLFGALYLLGLRNAAKATATVPQAGEIVPVTGGAVHFVESGPAGGAKQTVVCIHGLGANLQSFTYALTPILEREFRVIALDRPGCGYSERDGAERAPLAEQARMIMEFLDKQGVARPVLVGHSLGGALSLQMALDYPEKIAGIALLAPATQPMENPPAIFKPLNIASGFLRNAMGRTLAGALAPMSAKKTVDFVFSPEIPPEDFATRGGGALGLRPEGFIAASEDLVAGGPSLEAMAQRYGALKTPGVLLYGSEDAVLAAKLHGESFAAAMPSIAYEEIQGPGHMIPITEPERCAAVIRKVAALGAGQLAEA